ncbi:hypothetical protein [Glycomyces sp. NRRL B-16210]|uniref:hypothetical protein n=1 Tax=Glycomyces sp. NRRL B-16210 TaxID=1463821 RepID=UPI0010E46A0F|nr:hypothetical protein [Glycomyces sp. NRRL B-16210]
MTASAYSWLPAHQLGVAATLAHADEQIEQIGDLLLTYQNRTEGVFGLKDVQAGTVCQAVVEWVAPMPRKVPLLVADALVTLRAALEHALFAEVEFLDGAPLDKTAAKQVSMPASETWEDFEAWKKIRQRKGPLSLRSGGALLRRIDGLQPFHRQSDPDEHPLARLTLYTNHAKHRTPAVTAVRLAAWHRDDQRPNSLRYLAPRPEVPMQVGDVIAETPMGALVPISLFPTIGINRPDTDRWPVLMQELDEIFQWVRIQALPRLITGIDPPQPPLPARFEIAVGHNDERQAVAAGPATSATERYSQRKDAVWAHKELTHLIGQMRGAPGGQQIAAWIDHLPDKEVVSRVKRLDPTDAQRSLRIMNNMREEAASFCAAEREDESCLRSKSALGPQLSKFVFDPTRRFVQATDTSGS